MTTKEEYRWYTSLSKKFLEKDYLLPDQTLEERVEQILKAFKKYIKDEKIVTKFHENLKKGFYSLSTPVWSNYGTDRGLPISCFGSDISDNMESILYTQAEVGMMTKVSGGTSAYFGKLRGRGEEIKNNGHSSGAVHFMKLFETQIQTISQGSTRRGNFAAYLDIDHPDIEEFLKIKSEGFYIQDLSFGVCVPDYWLEEMIAGDKKKRKVWAKVLETRSSVGYPYIFFTDNANNNTVEVYKKKKKKITHTNLCSEIMLSDDENESFVCCLSSMNLYHYDEWKDTDAVEVLTYFLDSVIEEFIKKSENIKFLERANFFAKNQRAIGIGVLGWHSYLQSKMIPFESMEAKFLNTEIFKLIKEKTYKASGELAERFGEPDLLVGYGRRNSTTMAVAPTKSSAFILGQVSEGIEPHKSNYMTKDLAKGKFSIKNSELVKLLKSKGKNEPEVWESILKNSGSVQHLKFLSEQEKLVFKTFQEISPKEIVIQASARQKYIDQGQSLNLMIHPKTPIKDVNALILEGWKLGVKAFYYQISINAAQEFSKNILSCTNCES